jgi:hypothetical protein
VFIGASAPRRLGAGSSSVLRAERSESGRTSRRRGRETPMSIPRRGFSAARCPPRITGTGRRRFVPAAGVTPPQDRCGLHRTPDSRDEELGHLADASGVLVAPRSVSVDDGGPPHPSHCGGRSGQLGQATTGDARGFDE